MEKRIIRLTESDIQRIVKRVIKETLSVQSGTQLPKVSLLCETYYGPDNNRSVEFFDLSYAKSIGNQLYFNLSDTQSQVRQSYESSEDQIIISVEKITDTLKTYIANRVLQITGKQIDLTNTEFKDIMYYKQMGQNQQAFCSAVPNTDNEIPDVWINIFNNNNIAWDIKDEFEI